MGSPATRCVRCGSPHSILSCEQIDIAQHCGGLLTRSRDNPIDRATDWRDRHKRRWQKKRLLLVIMNIFPHWKPAFMRTKIWVYCPHSPNWDLPECWPCQLADTVIASNTTILESLSFSATASICMLALSSCEQRRGYFISEWQGHGV